MLIPIRTDSPLRHTPGMNWGIIGARVLMVIGQQVVRRQMLAPPLDPADLSLGSSPSYACFHCDAWHIVGYMLCLYIFGNNVNDKRGHMGYLAFYLSGAVFAGVGYTVG